MDNPIELVTYGKDFARDQAVEVDSCSFTPTFNALGTGEITVPTSSSVATFLAQPGQRLIARYRDEHLMSGRLRKPSGSLADGSLITYQLEDDWRILENTLAVVNPRGNLQASSLTDPAQAWQTGSLGSPGTIDGQVGYFLWPASIVSAEAAIKHILTENLIARLGRPVVIATNQDRGGDVRAAGLLDVPIRNISLAEAIKPLLDWSGLGLRVFHTPGQARLTIETFEPPTWPTKLSIASGILTEGSYTLGDPDVTRVIIGGPGDDAARAYYSVIDAALEAKYGDVIEVFKDATDVSIPWPTNLVSGLAIAKYAAFRLELTDAQRTTLLNGYNAAAAAALLDGSEKVGISLKLAETKSFHLHGDDGIHVGTKVNISSGPLTLPDQVTSATLAVEDSGLTITTSLGEISDDEDDKLWRNVNALAASLRKSKTQR